MLRQWVLRKSFNLFKNFGVWDIPKRAMLEYPNFRVKGPICRGGTFLKQVVPLKDSLLITYTKRYHSYTNDNHSSTLRKINRPKSL